MDNYNYPLGADTPSAPWNEPYIPEKEVEVCVSLCISKTFKVVVDDYGIEEDEGHLIPDFSECDLEEAVKSQVILPHELSGVLKKEFKELSISPSLRDAIEDCSGWSVDDLDVVLE